MCKKLAEDKVSTKSQIQKLEQNIESTRKQKDKYSSEISQLSATANRTQGENFSSLLAGILFPILLLIACIFFVPVHSFIVYIIFVITAKSILMEDLVKILIIIFAILWALAIGFGINEFISTTSAKKEQEILQAHRNKVSNQLTSLETQKNELQKQLNAIENRMRENKCS